jgi:hypothetical protein
MADKKKRKAGPKLTRSKTVTVRLDPKLHYLAEIASRVQRRTLSSYIEWAVGQSLENVSLDVLQGDVLHTMRVSQMAEALWGVHDYNRFVSLALNCPHLLTYDEQVVWDVIEHGLKEVFNRTDGWNAKYMDWVREHWLEINQYANGEIDEGTFDNEVGIIPF